MKRLLQVCAALAVAAVVAFLFVRSAQKARSEPYTVGPDELRGWTATTDDSPEQSGVVIDLRPPQALAPHLFQQVFIRAMESLNAPARPAMPLILHQEFEQAFKGHVGADALLEAARSAGLEQAAIEPVCLAHIRHSAPGSTRQLYLAVFRTPAFRVFRLKAAALLNDAGASSDAFDPLELAPIVFIGASEAGFRRWFPLPGDPQANCVAPIVTSR